MNKYSTIFLLFFTIFFTACGQKTTALNHFELDPISASSIQFTKKRDFIYKNEPKAMVFATYLNKTDKKYETPKLNSFIIGIHIANQENHSLEENRFDVKLNEKKVKNLIKLEKDSPFLNNIPLKNSWGDYYLAQFDNIKDIYKLNLKLTHPVYGQVQLTFDK